MIYLSEFCFPDADREFGFRLTVKRTCYDSVYPFHILSGKGLVRLEFEPPHQCRNAADIALDGRRGVCVVRKTHRRCDS